jgi:glyoxylase-like metal-dependent hydrolase (beta-lactamase superfamily II)
LILITHAHLDHYGSAAALKKRTGAPVAIHRLDAGAMASGDTLARGRKPYLTRLVALAQRLYPAGPLQADILLDNGDDLGQFGLPGRIVHTPGHTPGSCCLILDERIGIVGDLISTNRQPHLQRFFADDWDQLRESYIRLRELRLERAYPGHGRRSLSGDELLDLIDRELKSD